MENLAKQLKAELTARARGNEVCKTRLLNWVMTQFREGNNPVIIRCTCYFEKWGWDHVLKDVVLLKDNEHIDGKTPMLTIDSNGRILLSGLVRVHDSSKFSPISGFPYNGKKYDVTDTDISCAYAINGKDESDKRLYLESEGFKVYKRFVYGKGEVLEIYY